MSDITEHNTILSVNASGWVRYVRTLTATFQCAMDLKVIISESNSVFTPPETDTESGTRKVTMDVSGSGLDKQWMWGGFTKIRWAFH